MCAYLTVEEFNDRGSWFKLPEFQKQHPLPVQAPAEINRLTVPWWFLRGNSRDPDTIVTCVPVSRFSEFVQSEAALASTGLYTTGVSARVPDHSNRKYALRWDSWLGRETHNCEKGPQDFRSGVAAPAAATAAPSAATAGKQQQVDASSSSSVQPPAAQATPGSAAAGHTQDAAGPGADTAGENSFVQDTVEGHSNHCCSGRCGSSTRRRSTHRHVRRPEGQQASYPPLRHQP